MDLSLPFAEVLEAIDRLPAEDQEALIQIVRRRVAQQGRERLASEIQEAQREFAQGNCRPSTVDALMDEVLS